VEPGVGVRAVVHAHANRTQINAFAFRFLSRQLKTTRLVTGPFCKIIRKRSRNIPDFHGVIS
jgi:hypothetical protein